MESLLDEAHIMGYSTTPNTAATRGYHELAYSQDSTLNTTYIPPKIFFALACNVGAGSGASYNDTVGKQSKVIMLEDLATLRGLGSSFSNFGGVSIHDYGGWKLLPA
jgi:hypothetical protein